MKPKPIDYLFPYPYLYRTLVKEKAESMGVYERLVWLYFGSVTLCAIITLHLALLVDK